MTSGPDDHSSRGAALYGRYFGLQEKPFGLTPNPRFLFVSARQREALSSLRYGLTTHHGFTLMVGEAGCGKTTMLRASLEDLDTHRIKCVLLSNPTLRRDEFYDFLARTLELSPEASSSKARFLAELQSLLEQRYQQGLVTGVIVDEAQSLPSELLEEIRLLGNIELPEAKLLNIVLSGQPELLDRLQDPALEALRQRIALRCELKRFDRGETASYIAGRLRIAGGQPQDIFTQEAVMVIHEATGGLPRAINVLCENALLGGFAEQVKPVPARILREVAREYGIGVPSHPPEDRRVGVVEPQASSHEVVEPPGRKKRRFSFFALLLACVLASGASPAHAQAPTADLMQAEAADVPADFVIGPEDVLGIVFWRDADMSGDVTVRPDGMITLPLLGDIRAEGLRPDQLRDAITKAAERYLEDISVTVAVREIHSRKAFITGEVRTPGAYPLTGPRTVMQLIAVAGGLTEYADGKNITIMRVERGQTQTLKFNYRDVSRGRNLSQNVEVRPGDTIVVP